MLNNLNLVVVIPAYNEEACIENVIDLWTSGIAHILPKDQFKIIVINDGSKDDTGLILDQLASENPNLIAKHQLNGGHGNAVVNGYKFAVEMNPDYIFQTDSDDQFIPEDFKKFWDLKDQSDFILGFRQVRHDDPFRLFITKILKYSLLILYGTYINDANIPFRLYRTSFLKKLLAVLPNPIPFAPNIFLSVLAKKANQKLFNIPVFHKERETGEVSIRHMKLLKVCWQSLKELIFFRINLNQYITQILK
jgi:glycosyltransferase involved in cell wall biosynthesis